jgi:methanogenic corrinoid protein MtbC1
MVAEFFRRAGWGVWSEPACSRSRLMEAIRSQRFDVVGISVGSEIHLNGLDALMDDLRQASRNKSLLVMAGGAVFAHQPDLAQTTSADIVAMDAQSAVDQAESMLGVMRDQRALPRKALRVG